MFPLTIVCDKAKSYNVLHFHSKTLTSEQVYLYQDFHVHFAWAYMPLYELYDSKFYKRRLVRLL